MPNENEKAILEIVKQMKENVNNNLRLSPELTIEVLKLVELQKLNNSLQLLIDKNNKQ